MRRHLGVLAGGLAAVGFLKAWRLPNRWAATNFVLNYSQGFVRRGLVGEVARRLFGDAAFHYWLFVVFAFLVMAATAGALLWLCRRALAGRSGEGGALELGILVFLASPALVMLVHLVGYLDYLGLLFVTAFAALRAPPRRKWLGYWVAALAGPLLALVHEAQTILFMPVVLFVLACRELAEAQRAPAADERSSLMRTGRVALALAAVLALALGVSAFVSSSGDPQRVAALDRWLHQRADFTLHYGVARALKTGSPVGLLDMMWSFWTAPGRAIWWFKALILFLPSFAFLGLVGWRAIGAAERASRLERGALRALFLLACLSPLSLNVVAWDYARWFALAVTNALVCLLALHAGCQVSSRHEAGGASLLPLAAALTIGLGLASDAILFNSARVSYYPFFDQWQALGALVESGKLPLPPD
ncbi:MAG TPA: hypothetical protein VMG12_11830 [Polyangiaceae bacterium]|nr:hypothetical protein [Polyangiaceae bacterium]